VLTLRQQIDLVLEVLDVCGVDVEEVNLAMIDSELRVVARSKENHQAFARALAAIQRNSDITIVDQWRSVGSG
jgi:hypothetical protein